MSDYQWDWVKLTARRVNRSAGHLVRLCPGLKEGGFARMIKPASGNRRWQIRRDWMPAHRSNAVVDVVEVADKGFGSTGANTALIRITIGPDGTVTIIIQPGQAPGIPTIGNGHREAVERPSNGVQRTSK